MSSGIHTIDKYLRLVGVRGLSLAVKGKVTHHSALLQVTRADLKAPLFLRLPSADLATYQQVLVKREYDFSYSTPPRTIIDAGAHIGLASVYFANKFPEALIVAVEPEAENFAVLQKNVAPYPHVRPVQAAVWNKNTEVEVVDPGSGSWGYMTRDGNDATYGAVRHRVPAITIDRLMREHEMSHLDVLKVDIEGAEREVFDNAGAWIDDTDVVIAELHERLKPGCNRSFYNATSDFDDEWFRGENVFVARRRSSITASAGETTSVRIRH